MGPKVRMLCCVDCRAPNPSDRFLCYSCGARLDKIPEGAPLPGERSFPCDNCGAAIAVHARACPGCGRVLSSPLSHTREIPVAWPVTLDGWDIEPLPDGTYRLRRTAWSRAITGLTGLPLIVVFSLFFGKLITFLLWRSSGSGDPFLPVFLLLALVGVVCYLILRLLGVDELRAGPGFLEVWKGFPGWSRTHRIGDIAMFRVETTGSRTYDWRTLVVANLGIRLELEASMPQNSDWLGTGTPDEDTPSRLGRFLAGLTGWPFSDPARDDYWQPTGASRNPLA